MTTVSGTTSSSSKKIDSLLEDMNSSEGNRGGVVNISAEMLSKILNASARSAPASGGNAGGSCFIPSSPSMSPGLPMWPLTSPPATFPETLSQEIFLMRAHLAQQCAEIRAIKEDIRKNCRFVRQAPTAMCGPIFLAALLLAITLIAVAAIVLCILGLMDILPQVSVILQGHANLVWTIVSSSIAAVICAISVISISLYASKQARYDSLITTN